MTELGRRERKKLQTRQSISDAAMRFRFVPMTLRGSPTSAWVNLEVSFLK